MRRFQVKWQFNRTNIVCGSIAILGIVQFAASVIHSIGEYPGGYDVGTHFLSDLGRTRTLTGFNNEICASRFNRSLILLGILLIPFFVTMSSTFEHGRAVSTASGVCSAVGLIGIGSTPYNVYLLEHLMALGMWLVSTLLMVASFFVYSRLNRISSLLLAVITLCFFGVAWKYVSAGSHTGHVVFQKILVVVAICWFVLVFLIASISTIHSIASFRLTQEHSARRYIRAIERSHRRSTAERS